jgi:hypothetical protein
MFSCKTLDRNDRDCGNHSWWEAGIVGSHLVGGRNSRDSHTVRGRNGRDSHIHCKSEGFRKYFAQVYGTLQIALVHFFGNINKKA